MMVSVIVPTFNRVNMLKESIDSILNQTFQDFEIIVMDNCSVDDTESVIKSYNDKRIKYFKNDNHGILAVNMNYGMKKANGEYIAFCDDDDIWMPEKLEKQLHEFEKDDQIGLVCTNGIHFNENGDVGLIHKKCLSDITFKSLISKNNIINSSILIKKSVIDDVGMLDEEPEIFGSEEYSLWIRTAKKYKIKYIHLPLMKYRTHSGVYRDNELDSVSAKKEIYKKLLKNKIIDDKIYKMLIDRLNYQHTFYRLINGDNINLDVIRQTKTGNIEKYKLIFLYFLFRLNIVNSMQCVKNKILYIH